MEKFEFNQSKALLLPHLLCTKYYLVFGAKKSMTWTGYPFVSQKRKEMKETFKKTRA